MSVHLPSVRRNLEGVRKACCISGGPTVHLEQLLLLIYDNKTSHCTDDPLVGLAFADHDVMHSVVVFLFWVVFGSAVQ